MSVLDNNTIIIYIACICFLFLFGRIFILPIKSVLKLVLNTCIGGLMIYIINLVGTLWNFHIGLNYITAIFTGILGVPRSNLACDFKISTRWVKRVATYMMKFLCFLANFIDNKKKTIYNKTKVLVIKEDL